MLVHRVLLGTQLVGEQEEADRIKQLNLANPHIKVACLTTDFAIQVSNPHWYHTYFKNFSILLLTHFFNLIFILFTVLCYVWNSSHCFH